MKTYKSKKERIIERIENQKLKKTDYYTNEDFYNDAVRYIQSVKQNRMMCNIHSVSRSGMSRNLRFFEMDGNKKEGYRIYTFYAFFLSLGFKKVNDNDAFRIYGCGMDMVFHTNYTIIHELHHLGFLSKKQCAKLAQKTPHIV